MPGRLLTPFLLLALTLPALAQSTIPAIFLSDIHLDPYHDPAKVARLNSAPASQWAAILAGPEADPHSAEIARLNLTCPVRGVDTPEVLWESALKALHTEAALTHPRFITIAGDFLAHSFDCKFYALMPKATHEEYLAFTEKTVRYVLTSLQAAVPNTPIYLTLGNNDSGCTDYQLAPSHDEFLRRIANIAAEALPKGDQAPVLSSFPDTGSFSAPLVGVPDTRIIVLDDLFLSSSYAQCGGGKNAAPGDAQIAWLNAQLADARAHNQRVWILAHIPPGIDMFSTARKLIDVCAGARPVTFLASDKLRATLAANADVIRLALFGHTHSDEMGFIASDSAQSPSAGVPIKLTGSITPVNGNRPTFTVARIDPKTASLKDFTVFESSNMTGANATWTKEYTYSDAYHKTAFDSGSVSSLIAGFQSDRQAEQDATKAYMANYFPGGMPLLLRFAWPEYACSMNNGTGPSLAACICKSPSPQ